MHHAVQLFTRSKLVFREREDTKYGAQKASRATVLAIDDDPQIRRLFFRFLDDTRYSVVSVGGAEEALAMAPRINPSAVLLDLHLTDRADASGLECLSSLRRGGFTNPIYVLSADDSFDRLATAAQCGASGYIVKGAGASFWKRLDTLLSAGNRSTHETYTSFSPAAVCYMESRGLSDWDLGLLNLFNDTFEREKEISRILNRSHDAVRKQFQSIRNHLHARSQTELAMMLGVLRCFSISNYSPKYTEPSEYQLHNP